MTCVLTLVLFQGSAASGASSFFDGITGSGLSNSGYRKMRQIPEMGFRFRVGESVFGLNGSTFAKVGVSKSKYVSLRRENSFGQIMQWEPLTRTYRARTFPFKHSTLFQKKPAGYRGFQSVPLVQVPRRYGASLVNPHPVRLEHPGDYPLADPYPRKVGSRSTVVI